MQVKVYPDLRVEAILPDNGDITLAQSKLRKKARWIARQIDYFEQFLPAPPPKEYVGGETHYYLGRQYRLKIQEYRQEYVKLVGKYFQVYTADKHDAKRIRELLENWYFEHASGLFQKRLDRLEYVIRQLKVEEPSFKIRSMKNRWASLSGRGGVITFNVELLKAPLPCIDYVIVHELCHLKYPNHSREFYRLLQSIIPDWRERKERLEKSSIEQ